MPKNIFHLEFTILHDPDDWRKVYLELRLRKSNLLIEENVIKVNKSMTGFLRSLEMKVCGIAIIKEDKMLSRNFLHI